MERIILKRVLINSLVFSPDGSSTAYLYNDIALGLVKNGFDVVVITTTPHYNLIESELRRQPMRKFLFGIYYQSEFKGIKVYHVPLKKYKSTNKRLASFIYWHIMSLILGFSIKKVNFVLSPSPPLTNGLVSLVIAKFHKAKSIYNVQEIYPDLLINQGNIKSPIIIKSLSLIEKIIYNYSASTTTIDEIFYSKIKSRFDNPEKLVIIPNFVDTDLYKPLDNLDSLPSIFRSKNSKIKILYAGSLNFFQDWEPLLYAAAELKNEEVEFWIVGDGGQKSYLQEKIKSNGLFNIKIFPFQNRDLMPLISNSADIHFISVSKKIEGQGFPSKVYTIMACAKPLIVVTSKKTSLYNFLYDKGCAELITDNRNEEFAESVRRLSKNENLRISMGKKGLDYIIDVYSKDKIVDQYVQLFNRL